MDRIFTLHADHEQNASTSTVRLASSSGANPLLVLRQVLLAYGGRLMAGKSSLLEMLREIGTTDRFQNI